MGKSDMKPAAISAIAVRVVLGSPRLIEKLVVAEYLSATATATATATASGDRDDQDLQCASEILRSVSVPGIMVSCFFF